MIILQDVSLSFGPQTIFDGISVSFSEDQKIGVVGRNGTGKSTLLKVIAGLQQIDEGSVSCEGKKRIAYLPQDMVFSSTQTVYDTAFSVFDKFLKLEQEKEQIEAQLEVGADNAEELLERFNKVLELLAFFDRLDAQERTLEVLTGLGFDKNRQQQIVDTLSVGWKMRVVLAQLLLQQADFYLFDEPTNHLDISTQEWFLKFLKNASFGFLLVTHDRHFLENACTHILELERGNGTLFYGNFTYYLREKEERRLAIESAHNRQQKEIARKERTIERFKASASKARQMQSMQKQLDKMEIIEIEPPLPTVSFKFPESVRSGSIVLTVKNLSFKFQNKQIFEHVSFEVQRGQKLALVAPNGVGKTTLLNVIAGKLPVQTGSITFGHNVATAFFEQDQTRVLTPTNTIMEEVSSNCSQISDALIRAFLGSFLFPGDDVYKKIAVLSGGERNRVAMVKVLLQKANFLLLDEPTNHLDLYAKDVLLQALKAYAGTILFVSHDHSFIQNLATGILELTPSGLYYYPGTYEEFLQDKERMQGTAKVVEQKKSTAPTPGATPVDTDKEIKKLEQTISRLEHEHRKIMGQLEDDEYGSPTYQKRLDQLTKIEKELAAAMASWEKLQ